MATAVAFWIVWLASWELLLADASASYYLAGDTRKLPAYSRGKGGYSYVLQRRELEKGVRTNGALERLRSKLTQFVPGQVEQTQSLKITTIGGSITAGKGAIRGPSWSHYLFNYLNDHYPNKISSHIGAVSATMAMYMSACHTLHVPEDSDIIFVEFTLNEYAYPFAEALPPIQNDVRKAFERLLRQLLDYPRQPAVVLMHSYRWKELHPADGAYWGTPERELAEFASYYDIPELSVKGCCYHLMASNVSGFRHDVYASKHWNGTNDDQSFFYDPIHPDGRTGHRVMGELAIHLLETTIDSLKVRPLTDLDMQWARHPIAPPMIPGNYESRTNKCFIGERFTTTVVSKDGFEWINDAPGGDRQKWGFVSTTVGSALKIRVDTVASSSKHTPDAPDKQLVLLELAYLRSYEHMGIAAIECAEGCTCDKTILEGHTTYKTSLMHLHPFFVSQSHDCQIKITVLNVTTSGEHKIKVMGLIVSTEAGSTAGVESGAIVERVHDAIMKGRPVFDIRDHRKHMRDHG